MPPAERFGPLLLLSGEPVWTKESFDTVQGLNDRVPVYRHLNNLLGINGEICWLGKVHMAIRSKTAGDLTETRD